MTGRGTDEGGGGQSSPHVHIRKLCGPGAFGGGASDYADGDSASVTTSGPRAASTVHEVMHFGIQAHAVSHSFQPENSTVESTSCVPASNYRRSTLRMLVHVCCCMQALSTLESDDSFATDRRDRVGTKAEKELTELFERWLNNTTSVLRAAIFGDDTVNNIEMCVMIDTFLAYLSCRGGRQETAWRHSFFDCVQPVSSR